MNQTVSMEEQDPPKEASAKEISSSFANYLDTLPSIEEKLKACVEFMRDALAQKGTPNFKGFWEVRKLCLPFFKENLPAAVRAQLWADYIELTREGRQLKNLLDEETAFAVEQIDLAIVSLEEEVEGFHTHLNDILEKALEVEFPGQAKSLQHHFPQYQKLQKQLNLLNVYASKINALRKELIRTEMRIRQKNKFFQRLSILGDRVFPPRKELIREVSQLFVNDVSVFVENHFSSEQFDEEKIMRSVFFYRSEIKSLQLMAKILTLNTHAFSTTREQLSGCWDKLKGMEKELKKEYAQHKQHSSENSNEVKSRIEAFVSSYQEGALSLDEGYRQLEEISRWMHSLQLTRYDVRSLREALALARAPLDARKEEEEQIRRKKESEFERARKEKTKAFKQQVEELKMRAASGEEEISQLVEGLEEARKTLSSISMTKLEKQQLDRSLKSIRDQIAERQQQAVFDLSEDDLEALADLETLLNQRLERRKEIKSQIEEYRKLLGGSGLDFEKAIRYNELMDNEKDSLAKIDENINEIKKKIRELKNL